MRTARRSLAAIVLVGCVLAPGRPARGFSYFDYGGYPVVWWGNESLRYLSPSAFPPDSDTDLLYRAAMGLWVMVPSADFQYYYFHLDEDYDIDHYDGYADTAVVSEYELDPGVLAETYMVNLGAEWYDMDMLFSDSAAGSGWNFDTNPTYAVTSDPATHGISFLLVALHELGHALGLGHDPFGTEAPGTPWFIGTMNPRYPSGGAIGAEYIVEAHSDDRNGIRLLYPHSGPSLDVVDLANSGYATGGPLVGKAIPGFLDPPTAYPAEVVTLRSTIENFGNTHEFNVRQGFYLSTDPVIDTGDLLLGDCRWDIAMGDGFEFDVDVDLPEDIAWGAYHLGSILDDLNEVDEEYEDNNVHVYCDPLTIAQLPPAFDELGQDIAACGVPYYGPTPTLSHPLNMAPVTWSIDNPQPGMTINPSTGVIHWPDPVRSMFPYTLIVRATNDAGTTTKLFFLGVEQALPEIVSIPDQFATGGQPYVGPTPELTDPPCMTPILNWSLDTAPAGMDIDHSTGVVSWPAPSCSELPHVVSIRATNPIGNGIATWNLWVMAIPGDLNCDGVVDVGDLNWLADCMGGPQVAHASDCGPADFDADGDVDLADFGAFQGTFASTP